HILDPEQARIGLVTRQVESQELQEALNEVARYAFDLASEVPVRAWLFGVGPGEAVLVLVVHHIAGDGWSLGPLGRDLATAYGARGEGREPGWAPLPVQYGDYTLWQRELLGDEADRDSRFSVQYGYWARQLADVPEHVTVPADRARPAVISYAGDFLEFGFGSELHGGVLEVARSSGATAYMVLQAALAAL
ncbi:condensation domain-containing protein, partial [Streptomyces sp. MCAF7]